MNRPNRRDFLKLVLGTAVVDESYVVAATAVEAKGLDSHPSNDNATDTANAVSNVAALRRLPKPTTTKSILVGGHSSIGDGGGGTFVWDSGSSATDNGGTIINPTGHMGAGRWKRLGAYTFRAFGGKPDGVTNNYAAWLKFYEAGNVLDFGPGDFFFGQELAIEHQKILLGAGGMDTGTTFLRFPANSNGVAFYHSQTSSGGTDGSWSTAKDLSVIANAKSATGHGFYINAHGVRLQNVEVQSFKETGIRIHGVTGAGNANNWVIDNARVIFCDSHGFYANGDNANAGVATNLDCSVNGGWGIWDGSFLGNTFIACHTAGSGLGAYKKDNPNARTVFLGCYSESGQPASDVTTPGLVVGGIHAAGFTASSAMPFIQGELGAVRISRGVEVQMPDGADAFNVILSGDPTNGDILYMSHDTHFPSPYRLHRSGSDIVSDYANSSAFMHYKMTGPNTALTFGRSAAVPHAFAVPLLFTAANSNGRQITHSDAAPTSGEWAKGDLIFNNNIAAGGSMGWVCTTAGTGGSTAVFKAMPNVAA